MRKLALVCLVAFFACASGDLDMAQDAPAPAPEELPARVWVDFVSALSESEQWRVTRALEVRDFEPARQEIIRSTPLHLQWKTSRFLTERRTAKSGGFSYTLNARDRRGDTVLSVWNTAGVGVGKYTPTPEQLDALDHEYYSSVEALHPMQATVTMDDRSDVLASVVCRELLQLGRVPNYTIPADTRKVSVRFRTTTLAGALRMTAWSAGWEVHGLSEAGTLRTIDTNRLDVALPESAGDIDKELVRRALQISVYEVASWRAYREMAVTITPK